VTARLAPSMTADTQFFWDGLREHRLLIQRCASCHTLRHPPRPMCPQCHSLQWDTVEASGRGNVVSFVIPHHPPLPWFPEPYVVALIDLAEGTRLVSNIVGTAPAGVTIGMPVRVRFEHFDGDVVLPLFEPGAAL
jgi:uncharacterized OB-fold protein